MAGKWDERFMAMAKLVSGWSKDPSTKVGAVVVRPDKTVASVGYNGLPRGVPDDGELLEDRDYKLARTVHAELNAILSCASKPAGCTLYVWPLPPCSHCATAIIQSGITEVVSPAIDMCSSWYDSCAITQELFGASGVVLRTMYQRRTNDGESLDVGEGG